MIPKCVIALFVWCIFFLFLSGSAVAMNASTPKLPYDFDDLNVEKTGWPNEGLLNISETSSLINKAILGEWVITTRPNGLSEKLDSQYFDIINISEDMIKATRIFHDGTHVIITTVRYAVFFDMVNGGYAVFCAPRSSVHNVRITDAEFLYEVIVDTENLKQGMGSLNSFKLRQWDRAEEGPWIDYIKRLENENKPGSRLSHPTKPTPKQLSD